jgi:hypothetical protein
MTLRTRESTELKEFPTTQFGGYPKRKLGTQTKKRIFDTSINL